MYIVLCIKRAGVPNFKWISCIFLEFMLIFRRMLITMFTDSNVNIVHDIALCVGIKDNVLVSNWKLLIMWHNHRSKSIKCWKIEIHSYWIYAASVKYKCMYQEKNHSRYRLSMTWYDPYADEFHKKFHCFSLAIMFLIYFRISIFT